MRRGERASAKRDSSVVALWLAFAAVVGSFFASSFVVLRASTAVTTLSESIVENSGPSIEHMARVRRAVLETELSLWRFLVEHDDRARVAASLDAALADAKKSTRDYLAIAPYANEAALRTELSEAWLPFLDAVTETRALADTGADAAALRSFATVERERRRVLEIATRIIQNNAATGRKMAADIRETHRHAIALGGALDALCAALAVVVAWLLHRQVIARRALAEGQLRGVEARASELEQFAGRVAHDIRNPLAAAQTAAELAMRRAEDDTTHELLRRLMRSLSRANAITTALLDFARAGGKPDPGARTPVRDGVLEVTSDLAHDAARLGITLSAEQAPAVAVACSPGVYLSLLGNLVRNAMKYMHDAPIRRVVIRVVEEPHAVRTEVIDTGPGVPADVLPSLFEPYFRGPTAGAEGLGLGLATVRRLAEGHGGRVGATSERGKGSTFWFTLPRAGVDENDTVEAIEGEQRVSVSH